MSTVLKKKVLLFLLKILNITIVELYLWEDWLRFIVFVPPGDKKQNWRNETQ